jgi:hypothetical protein
MRSSSRRPLPGIGDVIRYAYLWSHEHDAGREDGAKDRPSAVVALLRNVEGRDEVVVLPITSAPPTDGAAAVPLPTATRTRLGLQSEPCWVVVSEMNIFEWPGPDLRPTESGTGSVVYGRLSPRVMAAIVTAFTEWKKSHRQRVIRRTE